MGFLIDTSLWIALERGQLNAGDIHALTQHHPVYLSPVNLAEIRLGIDLMTHAQKKKKALAAFRRTKRKPLLRITGDKMSGWPPRPFVSMCRRPVLSTIDCRLSTEAPPD